MSEPCSAGRWPPATRAARWAHGRRPSARPGGWADGAPRSAHGAAVRSSPGGRSGRNRLRPPASGAYPSHPRSDGGLRGATVRLPRPPARTRSRRPATASWTGCDVSCTKGRQLGDDLSPTCFPPVASCARMDRRSTTPAGTKTGPGAVGHRFGTRDAFVWGSAEARAAAPGRAPAPFGGTSAGTAGTAAPDVEALRALLTGRPDPGSDERPGGGGARRPSGSPDRTGGGGGQARAVRRASRGDGGANASRRPIRSPRGAFGQEGGRASVDPDRGSARADETVVDGDGPRVERRELHAAPRRAGHAVAPRPGELARRRSIRRALDDQPTAGPTSRFGGTRAPRVAGSPAAPLTARALAATRTTRPDVTGSTFAAAPARRRLMTPAPLATVAAAHGSTAAGTPLTTAVRPEATADHRTPLVAAAPSRLASPRSALAASRPVLGAPERRSVAAPRVVRRTSELPRSTIRLDRYPTRHVDHAASHASPAQRPVTHSWFAPPMVELASPTSPSAGRGRTPDLRSIGATPMLPPAADRLLRSTQTAGRVTARPMIAPQLAGPPHARPSMAAGPVSHGTGSRQRPERRTVANSAPRTPHLADPLPRAASGWVPSSKRTTPATRPAAVPWTDARHRARSPRPEVLALRSTAAESTSPLRAASRRPSTPNPASTTRTLRPEAARARRPGQAVIDLVDARTPHPASAPGTAVLRRAHAAGRLVDPQRRVLADQRLIDPERRVLAIQRPTAVLRATGPQRRALPGDGVAAHWLAGFHGLAAGRLGSPASRSTMAASMPSPTAPARLSPHQQAATARRVVQGTGPVGRVLVPATAGTLSASARSVAASVLPFAAGARRTPASPMARPLTPARTSSSTPVLGVVGRAVADAPATTRTRRVAGTTDLRRSPALPASRRVGRGDRWLTTDVSSQDRVAHLARTAVVRAQPTSRGPMVDVAPAPGSLARGPRPLVTSSTPPSGSPSAAGATRDGIGRGHTAHPAPIRRAERFRPALAERPHDRKPDLPRAVGRAERFRAALAERKADALQPLPAHLVALARSIVGDRPVALSTGPTSRRALHRAGVGAAADGHVVHLPAPPDRSRHTAAIVAHELVHVARATKHHRPRFLGDDHVDTEERDARRMATSIVRRNVVGSTPTVAPPAATGTAGLPVGGAAGLLQALGGAPAGQTASAATAAPPMPSRPAAPPPRTGPTPPAPSTAAAAPAGPTAAVPAQPTPASLSAPDHTSSSPDVARPLMTSSPRPDDTDLIDRIVDALERRVLADLERRGLHRPGAF